MTPASLAVVAETIRENFVDNGRPPPDVFPAVRLLDDLSLDSLALAAVIVALEEKTGKDPFRDGFIAFVTVEELASLYD
jgi:acyl carrier protein